MHQSKARHKCKRKSLNENIKVQCSRQGNNFDPNRTIVRYASNMPAVLMLPRDYQPQRRPPQNSLPQRGRAGEGEYQADPIVIPANR